MTTYVMEAADDSVLRQNQEYRIGSDVVSVISSGLLESIAMGDTMPSLDGQSQMTGET